ncbi:ABC transporter ATP-binding protein [Oceanobacillus profundus]|uniref:ABC transporter ATP-binding protein n=1 Tax=Oceanobacillus profundus TaxID=372463 RepID=A0A417YA58_9BACI|nr:ABC transporter ATP-binding protein [Oceanobacillus profundus]MCM3400453.1 ABC transporter ATP-binding protein [Oceanobacillus profundus]PAE27469.1 ABC transporter ATP-binding protein [Paenibacillus sp. 7884-2]RHW29559.1 ABC transporter ATP-binding protein [Oceanobacillus profundus]
MKIEVKNLSKKYKEKAALNNVSFTLDEPKIYGLLGRNGAGKTTFMDILSGQILPSGGEILIDGENPFDNQRLTESICLIKEGNNFKKDLKIKNVLKIYSYFYPNWDQELAEDLIQEYNLSLNAKVKTLSKGMESALGITVGLASKAPITIFDEPYIGLDAPSRKRFYEIMLEEYQTEKRTIIFSTHLIDEVSLLFEEVLILREGSLVLQEEAETLRDNAISVSGSIEKVEGFLAGKEVIERKQLAGVMTAYVYGTASDAKVHGLEVEGIPIQELMIYLTERKKGA